MRLQKFMAECGLASRRQSEKFIHAGKVTVNGEVAVVGQTVDPQTDEIFFEGKRIGQEQKAYILLNKPAGVITTAKDTHQRKTVLECLEGVNARLFPVGRLDMDVEGALILTNDGELAYRLTHPQYEIRKIYLAWVQGKMMPATAEQLAKGVQLEDGMTAPAGVEILNTGTRTTLIKLILHEGRKREIKRMCAKVGHPVAELQRIAVGNIKSKGLKAGEWRYLTDKEVRGLLRLVKLEG